MRKPQASTQNRDGSYWGAWVVTDIDEMRCAVFTTRTGLQNATIRCAELGHLYDLEVIVFSGELPTPSNLQSAIKQLRDEYLTDEKVNYFNYLKGVRDGRLAEINNHRNPTMTLKERLAQVYTVDRRERYEHD
jgi:hypothetical protein